MTYMTYKALYGLVTLGIFGQGPGGDPHVPGGGGGGGGVAVGGGVASTKVTVAKKPVSVTEPSL